MKPAQLFLLIALLGAPMLATAETREIQEVPFRIAGGQKVMVKISKNGAVPAENDKVAITAAAVLISPPGADGIRSLVWSFGLTAKTRDEIARITVENVFPSDPAVVLRTDEAPSLNNGMWIGQLDNGDPNGEQNGWLRAKGLAGFVFKFTVAYKDGTETVLHQLALFGENDKEYFRQHAASVQEPAGS